MNRLIFHPIASCLIISFMIFHPVFSQSVPEPAPKQDIPVILTNGIIHTGTGEVIEGDLLLMDGKVAEIGEIKTTVKMAKSIDLAGKHVYPGLIALNTTLGLNEIEAIRPTHDVQETGTVNTNVRSVIGYNTDSRVLYTVRSNGILTTQVTPRGDLFAGQSGVVSMDAWNWEDAAMIETDGMHLYWPQMEVRVSPWAPPKEEQEKKIAKRMQEIEDVIQQAIAYLDEKRSGKQVEKDLRWEALIPVLERKMPLYVHADAEKQIMAAVSFADRYNLKMVLVGGADAWLLTDLLVAHGVPVVLNRVHALPAHDDDDPAIRYKLPALLDKAGVQWCLAINDFWNVRNLHFHAGHAVSYGLDKEKAIQAVTLFPAKILGLDHRMGTIEPGKDATIIISDGDLLDMRTAGISYAFIEGRQIDLGNKQKDLYQKYSKKYRTN